MSIKIVVEAFSDGRTLFNFLRYYKYNVSFQNFKGDFLGVFLGEKFFFLQQGKSALKNLLFLNKILDIINISIYNISIMKEGERTSRKEKTKMTEMD